jgi:hypothetical protein
MSRIDPINPSSAEPRVKAVLDAQTQKWGAPLSNHLLYAYRPSIFKGARAMWAGLDASALLPGELVALLNRRVAAHVGCVF